MTRLDCADRSLPARITRGLGQTTSRRTASQITEHEQIQTLDLRSCPGRAPQELETRLDRGVDQEATNRYAFAQARPAVLRDERGHDGFERETVKWVARAGRWRGRGHAAIVARTIARVLSRVLSRIVARRDRSTAVVVVTRRRSLRSQVPCTGVLDAPDVRDGESYRGTSPWIAFATAS